MASDTLRALVDRCLAGESSAIREFVDLYQGRVFGLCFRMLGQRQDAEDMAQETFVRAIKSLHQWDDQRSFEPWLLAIAGNRCRTLLAKRQRRPAHLPLEDDLGGTIDPRHAEQQLQEEITLALENLRDEYRQAFLLFHEQELSYLEIAAALDCPLGTVKTWVHRARRELVDQLRRRHVLEENRHAM